MRWEITVGGPEGPLIARSPTARGLEDRRDEATAEAEAGLRQGPRPRTVASL